MRFSTLLRLFWRVPILFALIGPAFAAAPSGYPVVAAQFVLGSGFEQPTAVVAGTDGSVFVLDGTRNRVVVLRKDGAQARTIGDVGVAPGDGLNRPIDLAIAPEGLVVADTRNHRLMLYGVNGVLLKRIPLPIVPLPVVEPARKPPADAKPAPKPEPLLPPEPVAVSVQDGIAFSAERRTHRICKTRLADGQTQGCFGGRGEEQGRFQYPYQIVQDRDGYFNILDIANARVQVFDKSGRYFAQVSRFGISPGELFRPNGLAMDPPRDLMFVSDSYFGTISVFRKGEFAGLLQAADGQPVKLDAPTGLFFLDGQLFVAETGASRVRRYRLDYLDAPPLAKSADSGKQVELSQKNCLVCHLSWANEAPPAIRAADAEGALPEASYRMCYSCHNGAIMDSRLEIHAGGQHPTVYESAKEKKRHADAQPRKDKLPKRFPVTHDKQLSCTSCHTPHTNVEKPQTLYEAHGNAWLRVPNQGGDLCERCHESKAKGARLSARLQPKPAEPAGPAHDSEAPAIPPAIPPAEATGRFAPGPGLRGFNHPLGIKFMAPPEAKAKGFPTNDELHKGLPQKLAAGGSVLGLQKEMICQTCHQVHGGHGDGIMTVVDKGKGELCAVCHPRQFSEDKEHAHKQGVHPVNIERKSDEPGVKPTLWKDKPEIKEVTCDVCHKVHKGNAETPLFPEGIANSKQLCKNCHERQHSENKEEARKKGVHPVNIKRESDDPSVKPVLWKDKPEIKEVTCETCHKVHTGSKDTPLLPEGIANAEALCQNCHERQHAKDKDDAREKGVHPVNAELDEPIKIGKQEIKKIGCLSCHAVHKGKPDTPALVETNANGELCSYCHKHKQGLVGTDHDLRITAKDKKNAHDQLPGQSGACGACHSLHRGDGKRPFLFATQLVDAKPQTGPDKMDETPFKRDELCINCHQKGGLAEKKVVNHFGHPYQDLVLTSNQRVMPILDEHEKFADFGRIACVTCHEPHIWDAESAVASPVKMPLSTNTENREGTNRDSFLRNKNADGTFCVSCHGLDALVKYKYYHDQERSRDKHLKYLK